MPLATTLTHDTNFKALFVGAKHSGKTAAACSWRDAAKQKRIKVLDGDGRIRGILGCPWIAREFIDYDFYAPHVAGNTKTFFERVNTDLEFLVDEVQKGKSSYEAYVSDSATAFCKNLILDAIPLTHSVKTDTGKDRQVGKRIGTLEMAGPADYGFESTGFDAYLSCLRSLPINVIVTAHLVDKYDKPLDDNGDKLMYADSIVVGQKLSLRDKIAANCTIYFDHIFEFSRKMVGKEEHFYVEFINDFACTSFAGLKSGKHDITGKNFHDYVMSLISGQQQTKEQTKGALAV
jgi:hypothetical protein